MSDDIGEKLALYRAEKSLRQADVAKALGVTQQTVANWESGKPPKGGRLQQLRAYLAGVPEFAHDVPPVKVAPSMMPFARDRSREQAREIENEFVESLPEGLRAHAQKAIAPFGGYQWRADYISSKLVVEIRIIFSGWMENHIDLGTERALYQLATIRSIHQLLGQVREHYALVQIGPHTQGRTGHARLQSAATAHGITIYNVPDAHAAAALVADLEYGPLE